MLYLEHLRNATQKSIRDFQALQAGLEISRQQASHQRKVDTKISKLWDQLDSKELPIKDFLSCASVYFEPDSVSTTLILMVNACIYSCLYIRCLLFIKFLFIIIPVIA